MVRVLIYGGAGMLGHKLAQTFRGRFDVWTTLRGRPADQVFDGLFDAERTLSGVEATDFDSVVRAFGTVKPDVVVNAIGVIKQLPTAKDPVKVLNINSIFPHRLAALCQATGCRLISLSTDCVFNGRRGMYTETDVPDAEDLYGRSKYLGEVSGEGCLTLRTSIIGRELGSAHSLLEWFLSNRGGRVKGFTNAIYTGFTTIEMSKIIAGLIELDEPLTGLYHVSSEPVNKYDLLKLIRDAYGIDVEIEPFADFKIDRSLDSTRFRSETGYTPPAWPLMIEALARDETQYDEWRRKA